MNYWKKLVQFLVGSPGSGERARDYTGRYVADDKSTDDVNEAYKDGKTPVKRNTKTRTKGGKKPKSRKTRGRPKGSKNKKK